MIKDVSQMVEDCLMADGYDGLLHIGNCARGGCLLGHLFCDDFSRHCIAGYAVKHEVCKTCGNHEACNKKAKCNVQQWVECKGYVKKEGL